MNSISFPLNNDSLLLQRYNNFSVIQQPHFNDQESPIDCDDGELASSSNITRTTTIATVNSSLPSGSSNDNNLPSKSTKTNAETQTALRGVSLMEMIQRSSTTGTVDDIESGKCRNSKCSSQVSSGTNQGFKKGNFVLGSINSPLHYFSKFILCMLIDFSAANC